MYHYICIYIYVYIYIYIYVYISPYKTLSQFHLQLDVDLLQRSGGDSVDPSHGQINLRGEAGHHRGELLRRRLWKTGNIYDLYMENIWKIYGKCAKIMKNMEDRWKNRWEKLRTQPSLVISIRLCSNSILQGVYWILDSNSEMTTKIHRILLNTFAYKYHWVAALKKRIRYEDILGTIDAIPLFRPPGVPWTRLTLNVLKKNIKKNKQAAGQRRDDMGPEVCKTLQAFPMCHLRGNSHSHMYPAVEQGVGSFCHRFSRKWHISLRHPEIL